MPEGEQGISQKQEEFNHRESAMISVQNTPSLEHKYPTSSMASQRASSAMFCSQQSPHRVQSSTNLDLVDCVGSDLLLAMNSLDLNEQARSLATASGNGAMVMGVDAADGGGSNSSVPHSVDGFLPLAALAPPPIRQPAWITAQQQQARAQNEHFPARIYGRDADGRGSGSASDQMGDDLVRGLGGDECAAARDYDYSCQGGVNGGSLRGSPGAVPPPGFGTDGGGVGVSAMDKGCSSRGSLSGVAGGIRRPPSGGRCTPHLDESWTAVLNSPAGAELMEFLTERPSRALVLWNVEAIGEDDLRSACDAHGPLYYLRAEHRRKRVVFLAYYDVRDAVNAHQKLGVELSRYMMNENGSRPPPAVHFSVELHAGFSYKEGSLVVLSLPAQASEAEVGSVFQTYGDLRGVTRHPGAHQAHLASFSVEFYSIQDARIAAQELTVRNPWGHAITVEPAVRSESERSLGRQLHATLNRWTAEATQAKAAAQASAMFSCDERLRSTSSSIVLSGRSSDSDSPPPKPEDMGHDLGYMMDLYTPMTSANTTPATTPGSTPPSGADAYHSANGCGKSPALQQYMSMPLRQPYSSSAGPSPSSSRYRVGSSPGRSAGGIGGGSSSAGSHQMYSSSSTSSAALLQQQHRSHPAPGGHHPVPRMRMHDGGDASRGAPSGRVGGKPHPSPLGPTSYGSSPGASAYFVDAPAPGGGAYHGDRDDERTPINPMWAASLSPESARGVRGSPPLRGVPGGGGMMGCHVAAGGSGGLGYKDRARQSSLDEGRLNGAGGGGSCGGARNMRCNSDSAQMLVSPGPGCGGGGGDEFSLDLKKVSKGLDKRTTIMIRNIPNKYTQMMLLQEIDASYRGAYDFFYLPIDFKNKCNVGYAFINFIDYRRIVAFFREFNAQRWKNFNSEKVCAISYARIQGKASMISRFQNSSLMEKDGEYRPLIFHSTGAERGRPEPFPASSKVFRGVVTGGSMTGVGFGGSSRGDRERSMSTSSSLVL